MSRRFKPRLDILPASQRRTWPELQGVAALGFVLYGGTAIALRLGHRTSVDFDFFTDKALHRRALQSAFPLLTRSTVLQDTSDTITALVPAGRAKVKVSFFATLRMGRVGMPEWSDDGVAQVASLDDLFATKIKVLMQRVEAKGYLDVAAMLANGVDLARGLAAAHSLYGETFQPNEYLKALVYFKDGNLQSLARSMRSTLINAASAVGDLPKVRRLNRVLSIPAANRPRG